MLGLDMFFISFVVNKQFFFPKTQFLSGRKLISRVLNNIIVSDVTFGLQNTEKQIYDWYQMLQWHVSHDNTFCKEKFNF